MRYISLFVAKMFLCFGLLSNYVYADIACGCPNMTICSSCTQYPDGSTACTGGCLAQPQ